MCFRCLESGHINKECKLDKCKICQKNHHVLIHAPLADFNKALKALRSKSRSSGSRNQARNDQTNSVNPVVLAAVEEDPLQRAYTEAQASLPPDQLTANTSFQYSFMHRCLNSESTDRLVSLRFAPALVTSLETGKSAYVAALLDDGSSLTAASDKLARTLGVNGPTFPFSVAGINGHVVQHQTQVFTVQISDLNKSFSKNVVLRTLPDPAGGLCMTDWKLHQNAWQHLKGLKLPQMPPSTRVELIIGNDQPYFHRCIKELYGQHPDSPVARLTALGCTITGRTTPAEPPVTKTKRSHLPDGRHCSRVGFCPYSKKRLCQLLFLFPLKTCGSHRLWGLLHKGLLSRLFRKS